MAVPDIAKKLTIKTGVNAGKHPSVASVYRALADADAANTADPDGRSPGCGVDIRFPAREADGDHGSVE